MEMYLDGSDWYADYFITPEQERNHGVQYLLLKSASTSMYPSTNGKDTGWKGTVPGCGLSFLVENGELPDPYYARNLDRVRWMEDYSWGFRKHFTLSEELQKQSRFFLKFLGINYKAKFFLNNEYLGTHCGMFIPAEFDVTRTIRRDSDNLLAVIFEPAPKANPNHFSDRPAEFAQFHQCQLYFGWDWARSCVTTGFWDSVILSGEANVRITDVYFRNQDAQAAVEVELGASEAEDCPVEIVLEPLNFDGESVVYRAEAQAVPGKSVHRFSFDAGAVHYWYPNGYGEPALYTLTVRAGNAVKVLNVGFKQLAMRRNPKSPEEAYDLTFTYGGKPVFARGLDWVPLDMIPSAITADRYERQVRLAAEAGFNLFRVWGGGLIEKEAFYAACDRHGIMVWQEFMHACSCYEASNEFLRVKKREGTAAIRKIRSHVSLALWCGGNEMTYYGEHLDSAIYRQYQQLVQELSPGIDYHFASPDGSRVGEKPHGPWDFVGHAFANRHFRLLASELGSTSVPEEESLARFIPASEPDPGMPAWIYHFNEARNEKPVLSVFQPQNRADYIRALLFAQADTNAYWMERYRRLWPEASGCFFWQFNESWPTCAYSMLDYYTLPKQAYYQLAASNAPRMLALEDDGWCCTDGKFAATLWLCNDQKAFTGTCRAVGTDGAGKVLFDCTRSGRFAAGVSSLAAIRSALPKKISGGFVLVELTIEIAGETVFYADRLYGVPDFTGALHMPEAEVQGTIAATPLDNGETEYRFTLTNTGKVAALGLRVRFPEDDFTKLYFKRNYLSLAPGSSRTFTMNAVTPPAGPAVLVGWNLPETRIDRPKTKKRPQKNGKNQPKETIR